jgi:uncharacterized protein (DUF1501 family)
MVLTHRPIDETMTATAPTCCTGFSRSELMRRGAAVAGNGLPAIEPGMPEPAGTGLSRRTFIARSLGMAMAVYGAGALGPQAFEAGIAEAAGVDRPILVSVFLPGGIDSLTLLAPTEDPLYAQLRPGLAVAPGIGTPFAEDPTLSWHPSVAPLATLHGEGKLSVMPGIGYSGPNQSHFTSRHFWEIGSTDSLVRMGWMGRYLDLHGAADNPLQGLALGSSLAPALAASSVPVATVAYPTYYTFRSPGVEDPAQGAMMNALADLGGLAGGNTARNQARESLAVLARVRTQLGPLQSGFTSPVTYPANTDFNNRLASLAEMIATGMPLQCVAIDAPGAYDTHANQDVNLPKTIKPVADALLAFQRDLEARGVADRVVTLIWSEFGRRVKQNNTGTDHGAAGLGMLMGTRVKGTMIGEFPGLSSLDSMGNLKATSDFRALYSSLLESWLGVDAAPIIPGAASFGRYDILKAA